MYLIYPKHHSTRETTSPLKPPPKKERIQSEYKALTVHPLNKNWSKTSWLLFYLEDKDSHHTKCEAHGWSNLYQVEEGRPDTLHKNSC